MNTKFMISIARQFSFVYFLLLTTSVYADSLFNQSVVRVIRFPANFYGNTLVLVKEGVVTRAIYFNGICGSTAEGSLMSSKSISFNAFNLKKLTEDQSYNGYDTYMAPANGDNCRVN